VWAPNPKHACNIIPNRVFYVAYGGPISGLQANVSGLGYPMKIDFTGKTETKASVDLEASFN